MGKWITTSLYLLAVVYIIFIVATALVKLEGQEFYELLCITPIIGVVLGFTFSELFNGD